MRAKKKGMMSLTSIAPTPMLLHRKVSGQQGRARHLASDVRVAVVVVVVADAAEEAADRLRAETNSCRST
jgi:hypothetical protein